MKYALEIDYGDYDGRTRYYADAFADTPYLSSAILMDSKEEWFKYILQHKVRNKRKRTIVPV